MISFAAIHELKYAECQSTHLEGLCHVRVMLGSERQTPLKQESAVVFLCCVIGTPLYGKVRRYVEAMGLR
jgi:hypothetical protein